MSPSAFAAMPRLCLVLVLVVATVACGGRRIGAGPDADVPTMPSPCAIDFVDGRTIGIAPVASLGPGVRPQLAAFHGETLFMTVFTPCTPADEIVLWELNTRSHAATATPLGITPAGLWQALAVADDGTVWVGTRDALVHVRTDRSLERFAVPPARAPVPTDFVSRAGAGNAAGAITALAAVGDTLLLGRAGHREITTFSTTTQGFAHLTLPRPFGEVKAFLALGSVDVAFSATRASGDPLGSHDAVGVLDVGTERIAPMPLHPGVLAASGDQLGYASWRLAAGGISSELGVVTSGGGRRWSSDAGRYDATTFAVRGDGGLAIRLAGADAEIAFIDPRGREIRRVPFAAARQISGPSVPALVFAAFGPGDTLWFAVRDRPEIYRIP